MSITGVFNRSLGSLGLLCGIIGTLFAAAVPIKSVEPITALIILWAVSWFGALLAKVTITLKRRDPTLNPLVFVVALGYPAAVFILAFFGSVDTDSGKAVSYLPLVLWMMAAAEIGYLSGYLLLSGSNKQLQRQGR